MSRAGDNNENNRELLDQLYDYLHGELAEDQALVLEQRLLQDPEAVALCKDLAELLVMSREVCRRGDAVRGELMSADPHDSGAAQALAELARQHEEGVNQPISLEAHRKEQQQQQAETHRKVQRKARLILAGSIAALIAIAALAGLLLSALTQQPQQVAEHPAEAPRIVATLTKVHQAQWSGQAALAAGANLSPGQTLTLTQGFAEITTARGAVAILQAPATIELSHNKNALFLETGKLVGICETESSKGFLVRTPAMDITDLGTRFGVEVDEQQVLTSVFEGEVLCASPGNPSRVLQANQTATRSVLDPSATMAIQDRAAEGFVRDMPGRDAVLAGYGLSDLRDYELAGGSVHSQPVAFVDDVAREQITLAGWFYIEPRNRPLLTLLHSDDWDVAGDFGWQIENDPRHQTVRMKLGFRTSRADEELNAFAPAMPARQFFGQWVHLAASYDRSSQRACFYVNGELMRETEGFTTPQPMRLGPAQIGDFRDEARRYRPFDRQLHGRFQQVLLIPQVLPAEAVRDLYSQGRPPSTTTDRN